MTTQEKAIWELVHNWSDKQYAEIPDYNRRVLMDKILHLQERYRAQLELPGDEEIEAYFKEIYPITQNMPSARRLAQLSNRTLEISGAKWMRDHIAKQLKQAI